jgi:hypothetical protein
MGRSVVTSRDSLLELLRAADRGAAQPVVSADLAARARRIQARRRLRQRVLLTTGAAAVLVLLLSAPPSALRDDRTGIQTAEARASAADRVALLVLEREAAARGRVTARLAADHARAARLAAARELLAAPDPVIAARTEVELAAATLIQQADVFERELGLWSDASATYHLVLTAFPESDGAVVARRRIAALEQLKGESL